MKLMELNDLSRTLLWFSLSCAALLGWDSWDKHRAELSKSWGAPGVTSQAVAANQGGSSADLKSAGLAVAALNRNGLRHGSGGKLKTLANDVLHIEIDTSSGDVVQATLLKHLSSGESQTPMTLLNTTKGSTFFAQAGLVTGAQGKAEVLRFDGSCDSHTDGSGAASVCLRAKSSSGITVERTYSLANGHYDVLVQDQLRNDAQVAATPYLFSQIVREEPSDKELKKGFLGAAIYTETGKYQKLEFKTIASHAASFQEADNAGWVAMVQRYFGTAWMYLSNSNRQFYADQVGADLYAVGTVLPVGAIAPGGAKTVSAKVYIGPLEEARLAAVGKDMDSMKEYGWTYFLAAPMFLLLSLLHDWTGNWGWAIIGLVVILKGGFLWLNASSYKAMARMKDIHPKLDEARELYGSNPKLMQQEMMKIYRQERVNPMAGCLPILVQMPVFFALYAVLSCSVELRGAPWIWWIHDLSQHDPYFVLPAIMLITQFIQTWMTPKPSDPDKAKIMWLTPLLFLFMFTSPTGLVIYWTANTVLGLAQQWFIMRTTTKSTEALAN